MSTTDYSESLDFRLSCIEHRESKSETTENLPKHTNTIPSLASFSEEFLLQAIACRILCSDLSALAWEKMNNEPYPQSWIQLLLPLQHSRNYMCEQSTMLYCWLLSRALSIMGSSLRLRIAEIPNICQTLCCLLNCAEAIQLLRDLCVDPIGSTTPRAWSALAQGFLSALVEYMERTNESQEEFYTETKDQSTTKDCHSKSLNEHIALLLSCLAEKGRCGEFMLEFFEAIEVNHELANQLVDTCMSGLKNTVQDRGDKSFVQSKYVTCIADLLRFFDCGCVLCAIGESHKDPDEMIPV